MEFSGQTNAPRNLIPAMDTVRGCAGSKIQVGPHSIMFVAYAASFNDA